MAPSETFKTPSRLNVRLDDELRNRIQAAARSSLRSMNSEILFRLKHSFEDGGQAPA